MPAKPFAESIAAPKAFGHIAAEVERHSRHLNAISCDGNPAQYIAGQIRLQSGAFIALSPEPWDIIKRDRESGLIWLRKGLLIHNAGASHTDYEVTGNGTDVESTGLQLADGTNWIHAKVSLPTTPELTLDVHTARRADTATARYWPLWVIEWDESEETMTITQRARRGHIHATVWQLLTGWSASAKRALDTNTSGVLVWTETGDCEE
jgi:hypothetical protein